MARFGLVVVWLVSLFGLGEFQGHDHGHGALHGGHRDDNTWSHQSTGGGRIRQGRGRQRGTGQRGTGQRGANLHHGSPGVVGSHVVGPGQHGHASPISTSLDIPMSIPAGMSMEEARRSGILDALAHDASSRSGGTPIVPVQASRPESRPHILHAPSQSASPIGQTALDIPMAIPPGMSMEEARRSGILDALAHDASSRPGGAPSPFATGPVGQQGSVVLGTQDDQVPGRSGRRGRRGRRGRNGRGRNRRRRVRPAREPVDVIIDSSGNIVPVEPDIRPPPPQQQQPLHVDHGHGHQAPRAIARPVAPIRGRQRHGHQDEHHVPVIPVAPVRGTHRHGPPDEHRVPIIDPIVHVAPVREVHRQPRRPGQHQDHGHGPAHAGISIIPGQGGRPGAGTAGGILGELMRTAVQIGSGGTPNSPLFSLGQRGNRNNPVQIARSGPLIPGMRVFGAGINPFGQGQGGDAMTRQLGNTLFNVLGNVLG